MRRNQHAYDSQPQVAEGQALDERIAVFMGYYLREVLGRTPTAVQQLTELELNRGIGRSMVNYLAETKISIKGRRVLDLGAGLGAVSSELALHGAQVVALEPGRSWRAIVAERLASVGGGATVSGVGEFLPFANNSIDLVVSLQVLEHVQHPAQVIREVFRVLRPRGYFYLSCENYLAFWEPHYDVVWLPLLPKTLGALYLRLRGRSPDFLLTSIVYTTLPSVRRQLREAGFVSARDRHLLELTACPEKLKSKWQRKVLSALVSLLPSGIVFRMLRGSDLLAKMFRRGIYELAQKPAVSNKTGNPR